MQNDDDKKWLYDKLKSKGYDIGTYDEFDKSLSNDEDKQWYYEKAKDMQLEVGSYDDFNTMFGTDAAAVTKTQQQAAQQPQNASQQTVATPTAQPQAESKPTIAVGGSGYQYDPNKAAQMMQNAPERKPKQPTAEEKAEHANYMIDNAQQNLDAPDYFDIEPDNADGQTIKITTKNYTDKLVADEYAKAEKQKQDYLAANPITDKYSLYARDKEASRFDDPEAVEKSVLAAVEKDKDAIKNLARSEALDMLLASDRYKDFPVETLYAIADKFAEQAFDRAKADAIAKTRAVAIDKNKPKNNIEGALQSFMENNSFGKLAATDVMTTGHIKAREQATAEYQKEHPWISTGATIGAMAADPLTYLGGAMGKGVGKGLQMYALRSLPLVEKAQGIRYLSMLPEYRMKAGILQGAANFGTYEVGSELARQISHRDFNGYELADKALHGTVMGGVMAMAGGYIGNATNRWVANAASKTEAAARRVAGTGVGVGTEIAIFATPDAIGRAQNGDSGSEAILGSLKDAATMVLGFKAQHAIKGAVGLGRMAIDSRRKPTTRSEALRKKDFWAEVADRLTSVPEAGFTDEERRELEEHGYGDVAAMSSKSYKELAADKTSDNPDDVIETQGTDAYFDRVAEMLQDGSVSETARAKMAYVITGRKVPMSSVMGSDYGQSEDGRYYADAIGANGVISHRVFDNEAAARRAADEINRQAELNTIEIGERYNANEAQADLYKEAVERACEKRGTTSEELRRQSISDNEQEAAKAKQMAKEIDKEVRTEQADAMKEAAKRPDEIRGQLEEYYDVDIDRAIRKNKDKRTEDESKAIEEYVRRLYPQEPAKPWQMSDQKRIGDEITSSIDSSYYAGHEAADEEKNAIKIRYEYAEEQIRQQFDNPDYIIDSTNPTDVIRELREQGYTDREIAAVTDFFNARAAYEGMMRGAQERMQNAVEEMNATVEKRINKRDGMIHTATLKEQDEKGHDLKVYIIDGDVQMMQDGSMIDKEHSDKTILVFNKATGKVEFADIDSIHSVDEPIDAEQERQTAMETARQQVAEREGKLIDGVPPFNAGDEYNIIDEQGQPHTVKVLGEAMDEQSQPIDGALTVLLDGQQAVLPKEQLQQMSDAAKRAQYAAEMKQQTEQEQQAQQTAPMEQDAATQQTFDKGEQLTMSNGVTATVDDIDADGRIILYAEPGEKLPDGRNNGAYTREEVAEMMQQAEDTTKGNIEQAGDITETSGNQQANSENISPMPMKEVSIGKGKDAKTAQVADYTKATPQRTHYYIYNEKGITREQADDFVKGKADKAAKALEQIKKKEPKIGDFDEVEFWEDAHNQWSAEKDAAQAQVDYWNAVKQEQAKVVAAERAAQAEKEAARHDAAVIEEQQRKEAEAKAAAERAAVGNENPMPAITEKWNTAPKVDGVSDEIVLPNGERVKGHYVLTESGAATPSHQSTNGFQKSEGFPMDENGNTVNDRDYERDTDAQGVTRNIASRYDSRALQTPVVVSQDGVVLSGNGRTMAGELAAQDNTDTAYNDYLKTVCTEIWLHF